MTAEVAKPLQVKPSKNSSNVAIQTKLIDSRGKAFIDPRQYGGSMLDQSAGKGEPLNVIISALSSADVLTRSGLQSYLRSLEFDKECLGLHSGIPQKAFLDPRGWTNEEFIFRHVYSPIDRVIGTCAETLVGGNHLRAWQQQGSGAWFFAVSKEKNVAKKHNIVDNGYDIGRDELVSAANIGKTTSFLSKRYETTIEFLPNLLAVGSAGINHDIAIDGRVALLTIKILSGKPAATPLTETTNAATSRKRRSLKTTLLLPFSSKSNH